MVSRTHSRWSALLVVVGALVAVSAGLSCTGPYAGMLGASPGLGRPLESVDHASFVAHARGLNFESDPHVADEQVLVDGRPPAAPRFGPRARIEPVRHSARISDAQLRAGAVVARIIADGDYAPLGLRQGIQYVWIDSTQGRWRAVVVHESRSERVTLAANATVRRHQVSGPSAIWYQRLDRGMGGGAPDSGTQSYYGPMGQGTCGRRCCAFCPQSTMGGCPSAETEQLST